MEIVVITIQPGRFVAVREQEERKNFLRKRNSCGNMFYQSIFQSRFVDYSIFLATDFLCKYRMLAD